MVVKVILPKVDMDQESGTIVEWLKGEGDPVIKGESILVIETDKVAIDVESPASGIIQGIKAKPDEVIPIGTVIAYILESGEELPDEAKSQDVPTPTTPRIITPAVSPSDAAATPVARNFAEKHNLDLKKIEGTGFRGMVTKRDLETKLNQMPSNLAGVNKVYATPAARQTARKQGIDLTVVTGSGPGGRIQAADVLAAPAVTPELGDTSQIKVIPLQGMRRTIAERMTVSYQTTPHITFTMKVDMSGFDKTRSRLNNKAKTSNQSNVSVTALLVKAVAWALRRNQFLNSTLQEDGIHLLPEFNIGVAVALEEGLIVPVIHNADQKGIGKIANQVNDLATRARQGKLTPADVAGGTFTISNLGPYGIEQFTAIINPSQAAILAVGAAQQEVILDENDQIARHSIMRMTLSADHRIVDGSIAAHFLADLREALEWTELLLW
jgi:pyruvate dehydrogenase E2 component (dihydrolipoamide acetyltransferase)